MAATDFTRTLVTSQSPQEVFRTILQVQTWWAGLFNETFSGKAEQLNDEFTFQAGNGAHTTTQRLVELIANQRIVWLVTESNLTFLEKTDEWTGSKLIFEITPDGDQTRVTFTHQGLTPEAECYDSCAPAWSQYIEQKLRPLITKVRT